MSQGILFLFFSLSLSLAYASETKIAIIGGGISGSSSAYFIEQKRQQLNSDDFQPTVHIFEKEENVGGRVKDMVFTYQSKDYRMEVGASVYHTTNQFLAQQHQEIKAFDNRANLLDDTIDGKLSSPVVGWWDGEEFVIEANKGWMRDMFSFVWRYGLSPVSSDNILQEVIGKFSHIYQNMFQKTQGFLTPTELIKSVKLDHLINTTILNNMLENGLSSEFVNEIAGSINRCNYGQGADLNALAGWISQACQSNDLHSVSGGNTRLIQRMIATSGAQLRLSTVVTDIKTIPGGYMVTSEKFGETNREFYDAVIVASPLELNSITFSSDIHLPPPIQYHTTHVTLAVGKANPSFFGKNNSPPDIVLTTDDSLVFSSFAAWKELEDGQKIYKIFSKQKLTNETLSSLFSTLTTHHTHEWKAYPLLPPFPPSTSFVLHTLEEEGTEERQKEIGGVYYTNAMESLVSAMETQAIASFNVVQLLSSPLSSPSASSCEL